MAKPTVKAIRASLLKQLEDSGGNVAHFISAVEDYCYYEQLERDMQKDVKKRGVTYETASAQGKPIEKENPSVKGAYLYNKTKRDILKDMGLSVDKVIGEEDEL